VGTPEYMDPHSILGPWNDIYSLSIIMFKILKEIKKEEEENLK